MQVSVADRFNLNETVGKIDKSQFYTTGFNYIHGDTKKNDTQKYKKKKKKELANF